MPGIHLIGLSQANLERVLFSVGLLVAVLLLRRVAKTVIKLTAPGETKRAIIARFWGHQLINIGALVVSVFGLASLWFDDPARLATALGLVGAGLAFALQRVITAFAGYIVILNSGLFGIGDRINMGGVRGDVLRLGFMQTTLMEMGVAPGSDAGPAVWVKSRQFTGRIVTLTNAKIFEDPVYNYTRDFPYIWEELHLPVRYGDDRARVETILLEAARTYALDPAVLTETAAQTLEQRFDIRRLDFAPRVYCSLTSNYLQMSIRFAVEDHGTRAVKDSMVRDILDGLEAAGITVATDAIRVDGLSIPSPSPSGRGPG